MPTKRIAIVGGGCAGVVPFWAVNKYSAHEVHLFESSKSLGGRIRSLPFEANGHETIVGTGLVLFNKYASPNFETLLSLLDIKAYDTCLNFSISGAWFELRWGYDLLIDLISNLRILRSIELWQTMFDIVRWNYITLDVLLVDQRLETGNHSDWLRRCDQSEWNVREYLAAEHFSDSFCDNYLRPLLSIMWGTTATAPLLNLPIRIVVRLMRDHGLLGLSAFVRSRWQTTRNGGSDFIDAISQWLPEERVHLNSKVVKVHRQGKDNRIVLRTVDGQYHHFDHVVFAIPIEDTLQIIESLPDPEELDILRELRTTRNIAVLHSDSFLMPQHERFWSACNYVSSSKYSRMSSVSSCLTYSLNCLQYIPESIFGRVFLTLNPFTPPHPRLVQAVWEFTDLEINARTLKAQDSLRNIQGVNINTKSVSFCGHCWMGYGFYEDTTTSGLQVAVQLGANLPFKVVNHQDERPGPVPPLLLKDWVMWTMLKFIHLCILFVQILACLLQLVGLPRQKLPQKNNRYSKYLCGQESSMPLR